MYYTYIIIIKPFEIGNMPVQELEVDESMKNRYDFVYSSFRYGTRFMRFL